MVGHSAGSSSLLARRQGGVGRAHSEKGGWRGVDEGRSEVDDASPEEEDGRGREMSEELELCSRKRSGTGRYGMLLFVF